MLRTKVLSLATVLVSLLAPAIAMAQDATTPPPAAPPATDVVVGEAPAATPAGDREKTEEIVVTGSRIRRKDLTTPAPVTVINRDQILASGKVSIGDFLQALPEQGNAINTQINNGGDGSTRVNLRGLGEERTLVLVNGRRFVPGGTGADASVDLNSIPSAAVERVEILKDGASAIYGSDAIGGVVNLITRKGYTGTDLNAYIGGSSRGDGTIYDLNVTSGLHGDRGSLTFSAGYYRMEEVWAGDRDWSDKPYAYNYLTGRERVLGSYGVPQGALDLFVGAADMPTGGTAAWQTLLDNYNTGCTDPDLGCYEGWAASTFIYDPGTGPGGTDWRPFADDTYNYQPENYLVTPQQRISLYATGDTNLGDVARGYFEASYVNRRSQWKIAPEPLFTDGEGLVISGQNQYNTFGIDFTPSTAGIYRRLVEFGNRSEDQDIDTYRVVTGLDGTLSEALGPAAGWFWDANFNYGRTQGITLKRGNLLLPNLQDAVGPSYNFGTAEVPEWACVGDATDATTAAATRIDGCVPLDLFHGAGSIRPEQIANLTYAGTLRGNNQMVGAQVNTSGDLITLLADRPVGLALGYEYRRLSGAYIPDPVTAQGWTSGNKGTATEGNYNVHEGYAELSVPIVSGMVGVQDLEATVAARVFEYSNFGSDWTYKLGARYKPIPDVTVRGTYSTAFRAPSVGDLFSGQFDTFPNISDPCANLATAEPQVAADCRARHPTMPAGGTGDTRVQLRGREGGNPNLEPETADIFTVGLVLEPRWVKNLSFTVDYYSIDLEDSISSLGYAVILNNCYGKGTFEHCDLVERDPTSLRIQNIENTAQNVGGNKASGVDFALRYALPTAYGRFGFGLDATWLREFDEIQADGEVIDGLGTFDLADQGTYGVYPEWKANAGVTWAFGGFGAGVNTRYLQSFKECANSSGQSSTAGTCSVPGRPSRTVDSYNIWDAVLSYTLKSGLGRTNVAVGMQNVFDRDPPKIYNAFTASTDPSAYDLMGRFVYARLTQSY